MDNALGTEKCTTWKKNHVMQWIRLFLPLLAILAFLPAEKTYASRFFFVTNYELIRPGESRDVVISGTLAAGEKVTYICSDPSVAQIRLVTDAQGNKNLRITGKKRGAAKIRIKSNYRNSNISGVTELNVRVANYKIYEGYSTVCTPAERNSLPIRKVTISGNRLILDGAPMVYTKNGKRKLKQKRRVFKLTKDTFYARMNEEFYVYRGKAARKQAKNLYRAPIIILGVEGKKVLLYNVSS